MKLTLKQKVGKFLIKRGYNLLGEHAPVIAYDTTPNDCDNPFSLLVGGLLDEFQTDLIESQATRKAFTFRKIEGALKLYREEKRNSSLNIQDFNGLPVEERRRLILAADHIQQDIDY